MPQTKSETSFKATAERAVQPVYPDGKAALKAKDEPAKIEEIAK